MRTSYDEKDVILLLKDITGLVEPTSTKIREKNIQSGMHYSQMLPIEYVPSQKYIQVYNEVLKIYAKDVANALGNLCDTIIKEKGNDIVIVSLARAGTPIGILIKRYMEYKYNIKIPHYSISIIRDKGIDDNAMKYLLKKYDARKLLFVDGWTGKGVILNELKKNLKKYDNVSSDMAVISDPANVTHLCGTKKDILIPSCCLNSTVSGLISRTFLRDDIIKEDDFHGAVYYENLANDDVSYQFINEIEINFSINNEKDYYTLEKKGINEIKDIMYEFDIKDINLIKPGIGETTRVLLRRIPEKIIIDERYKNSKDITHIIRLSKEKNVNILYHKLSNYKCCGIIKNLSDL